MPPKKLSKKSLSAGRRNIEKFPQKQTKGISKTGRNSSKHKIEGSINPLFRNVLFRPDRWKYVRKVDRPLDCVFCASEKSGLSLETLCVYQSSQSMILLNKYPYNSGHLLVLPRVHCGNILELSEEVYLDLQNTVRLAFLILEEVYKPQGINFGMNHGAAAGAGIPEHLHYHLVPRWAGDLNYFPLIGQTKVVVETLEETYGKIIEYLKSKVPLP